MRIQTLDDSPRNERGAGQVSYLLLAEGQFDSEHLSITWVEGKPGSEQPLHSHPVSEQVYVIVRGRGRMTVGDEVRELGPGTLVFIPPGNRHAVRNIGDEPLVFVSATSPPFEAPTGEFAYSPVSP